jgi:hypothetical protein
VLVLVQIYGIAHLWMGIPVSNLLRPFLAISVPTLLVGPSLYWANRLGTLRIKKVRSGAVACTYLWLMCIVDFHYLAKLGVIAAEDAVPMYIVSTIGCGLGFLIARRTSNA